MYKKCFHLCFFLAAKNSTTCQIIIITTKCTSQFSAKPVIHLTFCPQTVSFTVKNMQNLEFSLYLKQMCKPDFLITCRQILKGKSTGTNTTIKIGQRYGTQGFQYKLATLKI